MYKMGPSINEANISNGTNQSNDSKIQPHENSGVHGANKDNSENLMKYQYNMSKVAPFYLQKRKKRNQESGFIKKQKESGKKGPFITFEDLKKNL